MNWPTSRAVHSLEIEKVRQVLTNLPVSAFSGPVSNKKVLQSELAESATIFRDWVNEITDLSQFPHAYAVHGVTDAIHQWLLLEERPIQRLRGDYRWVSEIRPEVEVIESMKERDSARALYLSNPGSEDGCYRKDWPEILAAGGPITLDCAYVGSVPKQRIVLNENVERIFFSFSKGFGLSRLRLGWYFSRRVHHGLEQLHSVAYHPGLVSAVTRRLVENFAVDEMARTMRARQEIICRELGIEPADSYLIGHGPASQYPAWAREGNGRARIPLAYFYSQQEL